MRLYDLSEQMNDLIDVLEGSENPEAIYAMIEGLEGAFDSKAESIVKLMRSKEAEHHAISAEATRLIERAARVDKEMKWLHGYIESQMIATGKEEVKSTLFDIKLGKCPPAVTVLNESLIPRSYFTQPLAPPPAIDKRKLLDDLKAGIVVTGAEMTQRKTLRIK